MISHHNWKLRKKPQLLIDAVRVYYSTGIQKIFCCVSLQNVHQDLIWLLAAGAKKTFKWVHFEAVYLLESCRVLGQLHFSWVL